MFDEQLANALWFFDGAMLVGEVAPLRSIGFDIAIVPPEGYLLGTARGPPPQWCTTDAAVEAWALLEVLRQPPSAPRMRTDCLSLLKTAKLGLEEAVHPNRPLARIWRDIGFVMDGDIKNLHTQNLHT